ncbi:MAG: hypothetical protein IPP97_26655 [Candidatus Obscuribacter sp.]|nr:hypothetical protein [Candidatus Obscuribacter sp.]
MSFPGTITAYFWISEVEVSLEPSIWTEGSTFVWKNPDSEPGSALSEQQILALLSKDAIATLTLEVSPHDPAWGFGLDLEVEDPWPLPTFTCVNGDIHLKATNPRRSSFFGSIYKALNTEAIDSGYRVYVNATGLNILGSTPVPWDNAGRFYSEYSFFKVIQPPIPETQSVFYRMVPLLGKVGKSQFAAHWKTLENQLNGRVKDGTEPGWCRISL